MIEKVACDGLRFRRQYCLFRNARGAIRAFLEAARIPRDRPVLLPAYVGWSPREGSGIFDPIRELQLSYFFYRLDDRLRIDLDDFERMVRTTRPAVVLIVHYFGFVDAGYANAVDIARAHNALVLEDEAHAMLTDLVGGLCGRLADACVFSLHKLLPVPAGGLLLTAPGCRMDFRSATHGAPDVSLPWEFDLKRIAERRIANYEILESLCRRLERRVDPLYPQLRLGEVPQTFPVFIRKGSRDRLYHELNAQGFGAVSLYHTLIDPIEPHSFPVSYNISRNILNLPVHQDAEPEQLAQMIEALDGLIGDRGV